MCGDSKAYPSNLHYCHPMSGRQQENAVGGGNGRVLGVSRWETVKFRAFSVREAMVVTGEVQSCAPRVVLRFEGLENGFGTQFLNLGFVPAKRFEIQPGGDGSRASEGSPTRGRRK